MMGILVAILCILGMLSPVIVLWVIGIDYMKENHPDYKGDDFLNWGNERIDDEFTRQARANQPEILGKKPKTQADYAREHSKPNPKQFDGIKSEEPFIKTRKKNRNEKS